jgi:alpha-glucosidase
MSRDIHNPAPPTEQEHSSIYPAVPWWQRGVIYQIYPRSFADSNGDGVGDIRGILGRLDYLRWLGVDAIWISPIYPSPMADFGYDVSDYTDIHPMFGTLEDFDALLSGAHAQGIRVVLDLVPNHTSDEHPWFIESRSACVNPKRDWYIWKPPAPDGGPPNNWLSTFGGSAWELDPRTSHYYYHAYLAQQPDLNWRNPEVQAAMHQVLRFWLDRGVDGFRVDVIWHLIKDDQFRSNPPNPQFRAGEWPYRQLLATYTTDRPEVHDIIGGMRRVLDEYDDRLMIGEVYLPVERLVTYYGASGDGCHLPFNFQLIEVPWNVETIAATIDAYEAALPAHGWPNWVLGNHDKGRLATRIGHAQTRVAAMLLLTLRGTPTLYYGDELGMTNVPIAPEDVQDPWEKNVPGFGLGRDPARTPMQWDASEQAGFTSGKPWLPLSSDAMSVNVHMERNNPASLLHLYRSLIALRRTEQALTLGHYKLECATDDILLYRRDWGQRRLLVALNFSPHDRTIKLPRTGQIRLSTYLDRQGECFEDKLSLRSHEGIVADSTGSQDNLSPPDIL